MAEAYKCDRCKNFFDGKPSTTVAVRQRDEQHGETKFYKSVCEGCAAIVKDFVEDVGFDQQTRMLTCLKNVGVDTDCGACMQLAFTGKDRNDHTCKLRALKNAPCEPEGWPRRAKEGEAP